MWIQKLFLFFPLLLIQCQECPKSDVECGLRVPTLDTAIGERNENSVFAPWAVSIGYYDEDGDYIHGCTGSIIAEKVILTAAHCTLRNFNIVRAGVTDLRFAGSIDLEIQDILIHPDYEAGQNYNDIALLFLKTCLAFSYNSIQPICLPTKSQPNPDSLVGFAVATQGWGLDSKGQVGQLINEIAVTIRPKEECNLKYQSVQAFLKRLAIELQLPKYFNAPMIYCADHTTNENIGTCKGDSGGPSFRRIFSSKDYTHRFTIEGVVSGNADGVDCSGTLPDFYTFVAHEKILPWITSAMEDNSCEAGMECVPSDSKHKHNKKEKKICCDNFRPSQGFLIAGGANEEGDSQVVEVYIPSKKKTCKLEDLPDNYRYHATMCGGLLCGGALVPSTDYCLRLDGRTFRKTPVERSIVKQSGFSCWDLGDRGVLIMGYNYYYSPLSRPHYQGDNRTTELVSANGLTSSPSFPLKHKIIWGCGIDLVQSFLLSGGSLWTGSDWEITRKVSRYSTNGWTEDLSDLNIARWGHVCSFYTTGSGDKVPLVTGGWDAATKRLSSTEIYRNKAWIVLSSAALPSPTSGLSAGNIDNTIFVFGGFPADGILKFNSKTEKWEDVGSFTRWGHAMQVVDDAEKYCN